MKTMGLIGGMSWESTVTYYQLVNRIVRDRLGGLHSAQVLMWSFDFHDIETCQADGRWDEATKLMTHAACRLRDGGADFLLSVHWPTVYLPESRSPLPRSRSPTLGGSAVGTQRGRPAPMSCVATLPAC